MGMIHFFRKKRERRIRMLTEYLEEVNIGGGGILPLADDVAAFSPEHVRGLSGELLAEYIRTQGGTSRHCESLEDALAGCFRRGAAERKNIVFGSLSFIGAVKQLLKMLY